MSFSEAKRFIAMAIMSISFVATSANRAKATDQARPQRISVLRGQGADQGMKRAALCAKPTKAKVRAGLGAR